LNDVHCIIISL